ncbi:serine threonine isoform A [Haematococcus lacustris]|uniref:Serine threonine isoform A n=1 Tax=Haematococcus lacustris TaxID=44745 RepID=A0A699ZWR4_HAELA|nr:serine threonine isoform A [Haematococcus lacustris]
MEEDDMDPRTLEAAAARLAQNTSDQPVGNLPLQQWADIYKETGAEEVCSDAGCDLVMLVTHSMQPETNAPQAAGGVDPSMGAQGEAGQGGRAAEGALGTAAAARGAAAGAEGGGAAASQGSAGLQPVPLSCGPHKGDVAEPEQSGSHT